MNRKDDKKEHLHLHVAKVSTTITINTWQNMAAVFENFNNGT